MGIGIEPGRVNKSLTRASNARQQQIRTTPPQHSSTLSLLTIFLHFYFHNCPQCLGQESTWDTANLVGLSPKREASGTPSSRLIKTFHLLFSATFKLLLLITFPFQSLGPHKGKITGSTAKKEMVKSRLPNPVLAKIWRLADVDQVIQDLLHDVHIFCLIVHHFTYICHRPGRTTGC